MYSPLELSLRHPLRNSASICSFENEQLFACVHEEGRVKWIYLHIEGLTVTTIAVRLYYTKVCMSLMNYLRSVIHFIHGDEEKK